MINRFIFNQLKQELTQPEIDILLGARQVGKTTLLKDLAKSAEQAGHRTVFFDLEQPQVLAEFNRADLEIIERIRKAGEVIFSGRVSIPRKCFQDSQGGLRFIATD